jgi:hypothetical protein
MKLNKQYIRDLIKEELAGLSEQEPQAQAQAEQGQKTAPKKDSALGAGGKMNAAMTAYGKFSSHSGVEAMKVMAQEGGVSKLAVLEVLLTDVVGVDPALMKQNLQMIKKLAGV